MAEQKKGKGFLMVSMEPTPAYDEEFNDWYDMEHIPERTAIPGFESGRRYVCLNGWPRLRRVGTIALYRTGGPATTAMYGCTGNST